LINNLRICNTATKANSLPSHCNFCGLRHNNNKFPFVCASCDNPVFYNPIPVGIGMLPFYNRDHDLGFLLVRRTVKPHIGELCLPGGFIDWNESWQEGISREVYEETNIETDPSEFNLVSVNSTPDNKRTLIFGMSEMTRSYGSIENFNPTNETSELVIGTKGIKLCFPLQQNIFDTVARLWSIRE